MNVIPYIRYIRNCFFALQKIKKTVRYDIAIEQGWYYISVGSRSFLYNKKTPKKILTMIGVDVSKPSLLYGYVRRKNIDSIYKAQIVMTTNGGVRYFNCDEGTTLHEFSNSNEYSQYKKCCDCFMPPFKTTALHISEKYCVEKMVNDIPRKEWSLAEQKRRFYGIFEKYIEYLTNSHVEERGVQGNDCLSFNSTNEFRDLLCRLNKEIEPYRTTKYVFSHGDLHFENVLFDKEDVFLLDFEMAGTNVFFYDIFNLMYVEYIDKKNQLLLDAYLSKDTVMMNYCTILFDAVGEKFDTNFMYIYFKLFLRERIKQSVSHLENNKVGIDVYDRINRNVNKINRIINKIKDYEV